MSSGKSKKFCVEDALTLLLDGNQSDIVELDSDDDDDDDEVRCDNSGFFIQEVDVNDKDNVDTDGSCEENDDDNDSVADDATMSEAGKANLPSLSPQKKHVFRWRKRDIPPITRDFVPHEENSTSIKTPFEYF